MKTKNIFYALILLVCSGIYSQTTIYVSPKGNDNAAGSATAPFKTIQTAINKSKQIKGAVVIELFEGNYQTQSTIEISRDNITIKSNNSKKVSVSGDITIPVNKATKIKDKEILSRIEPKYADKIYEIDFSKLGIKIEGLHSVGFGRPSKEGWSELVINGETLNLSRWPNENMEPIGKVLVSGDDKDKTAGNLPVFKYKTDRPKRWEKANEIWISGYFGYGYADDMIAVKQLTTKDSTFYMSDFTTYQFRSGAAFLQWFAVNLLEEIDVEGEYSIDNKSQKIYFMPKGKVADIRLLTLKTPVFAIENCKNVSIENITIENSRQIGVYIENAENAVISNCTLRNLGSVGVCMGKGNKPSSDPKLHNMANGDEQISRGVGGMGGALYKNSVLNRQAGKNNGIKNSYIYNTGAGGVILSGGDRLTLEKGNSFVENCKIYNYNRIEKSYRPGVWMDGVGNRITRCNIFNAPSMAILFHGNENVIEYSDISNVCTEVDDQGAVYYGRDPSERGNIMRYNYFHDFSPKHRVSATYHDDLACDGVVYGNIYYKAGSKPVLIGGGKDNRYYNNIFIESPCAIHIDNRGQNWAKSMTLKGDIADKRLLAVNYNKPPYSTAYPQLLNYWEEGSEKPLRNVFNGNLFVKNGNLIHGSSSYGEFYNNWETQDDPGFKDIANPLKGFKEGAEVFNKIKDFPKLPFEKIGCKLE